MVTCTEESTTATSDTAKVLQSEGMVAALSAPTHTVCLKGRVHHSRWTVAGSLESSAVVHGTASASWKRLMV